MPAHFTSPCVSVKNLIRVPPNIRLSRPGYVGVLGGFCQQHGWRWEGLTFRVDQRAADAGRWSARRHNLSRLHKMNWLEVYGRPFARYRGVGTLHVGSSARHIEVQFEVAQLPDGQIFCELKSDSQLLGDISSDCALSGSTEYGYKIHASRLMIISKHVSSNPTVYSLRAIATEGTECVKHCETTQAGN